MRDTLFSGSHTYRIQNFWSKDSNHEKVIVVANCRTGHKFEDYKNTQDSNK